MITRVLTSLLLSIALVFGTAAVAEAAPKRAGEHSQVKHKKAAKAKKHKAGKKMKKKAKRKAQARVVAAAAPANVAPSRAFATRAGYDSVVSGDSEATVAAKMGGARSVIRDQGTVPTIFTGPGVDEDGNPTLVTVAVGLRRDRSYESGPKQYYDGTCWDYQITFVERVPFSGLYTVVKKESWSNICYVPPGVQ